jgi:hypothetical protein
MITVESLGALYTDLYNPEAHTMPFVSGLFNAALPGSAFLLERIYATEPNTLHSLFASLCGMRPPLGMKKTEYSHKRRLSRCLPALLRDEGIHAAFYTTSNSGFQRKLGFAEVWSSVEEENAKYATPRKRGKSPRYSQNPEFAERIHWPADWWKKDTASLLRARTEGQYNWLGDHDFFGLPKVRDFVAAQGEQRFFLHLLTVSTHHPYLAMCPSSTGYADGVAWRLFSSTLGREPNEKEQPLLRKYLEELRCVDEYIK